MFTKLKIFSLTASLVLLSNSAWSSDARSLALGGSTIANANGAHGAMENPASMMAMKRANKSTHFRFGIGANLRVDQSVFDTLTDSANQNLVSDISDLIDTLDIEQVLCDPISGAGDDVCVDNTQEISDLATRLLNIMVDLDDETYDLRGSADFGFAFTGGTYPMAVHLKVTGTAASTTTVADTDIAYIEEFADLFDNNTLTLEEAQNSSFLEVDALGVPLAITQPEDVLQSGGSGSAMIRTQLGISFASSMNIAGYDVDIGLTPKFSELQAYNLDANIADQFDTIAPELSDEFEDSEVSDSSITIDVGASTQLANSPVRVAAVLRNLIPESITTMTGFKFETTPQLIVGGAYQAGKFGLTADLALNSAKVDNFESQLLSIGAELGSAAFALRAGISHDLASSFDPTSLMLGVGLGPFHLATRISGDLAANAAFQVSHSF